MGHFDLYKNVIKLTKLDYHPLPTHDKKLNCNQGFVYRTSLELNFNVRIVMRSLFYIG